MTNTTEFPYTIKSHTKLAELQILKTEETKQIRHIDAVGIKKLEDPDGAHMYVNELTKAKEDNKNDANFWFITPEIQKAKMGTRPFNVAYWMKYMISSKKKNSTRTRI